MREAAMIMPNYPLFAPKNAALRLLAAQTAFNVIVA
jgi:hypothetical protein